MRILPLTAALVACAVTTAAYAALPAVVDTFKSLRYSVPSGWKANKTETVVTIKPEDEEGLMGVFLIPGDTGKGGADKELDEFWEGFTGKLELEGSIKSRKTFKTDKGMTFAVGFGELKNSKGQKLVGMLAVYEGEGRFDYAMTLAQDTDMLKKYSKNISKLLHSVEAVAPEKED